MLALLKSPTFPSARDLHASAADGRLRAAQMGAAPAAAGQKLGVLKLSGPIVKGISPEEAAYWGVCSVDSVHEGADRAEREGITQLVVHLDSPGGMVCGTAEAADRLRGLRENGMHLVAYTDTMACSAAYWLAAACDEIVAAPSASVGSIGCICQMVDVSQMLEGEGIKVEYFVNEGSEAKLHGRPGVAISDEARAAFQASVDAVGAQFKAEVAAGRPGLAPEDMTGAHWAAKDAPAGYVDHTTFPDARGVMRPVARVENLLGILAGL